MAGDDVLHAATAPRIACAAAGARHRPGRRRRPGQRHVRDRGRAPGTVEVPVVIADDAPPRIAWRAGSDLGVVAEDDRGVAMVQWRDDDRVLCTDTEAPYDCEFRPRIQDVGNNTLVAIAVDSAGQTAVAVTSRAVERFTPVAVSLTVKRSGSRYVASGAVTLPAGVPCSGTVVVGKRKGRLSRSCTFRFPVPRASRYVADYLGTTRSLPSARRVRCGREASIGRDARFGPGVAAGISTYAHGPCSSRPRAGRSRSPARRRRAGSAIWLGNARRRFVRRVLRAADQRPRGHPGKSGSTLTYTAAPGRASTVTFRVRTPPTRRASGSSAQLTATRSRPRAARRPARTSPARASSGSLPRLGDGTDRRGGSSPARWCSTAGPAPPAHGGAAPTPSTAAKATTCWTAAPATTRSVAARATTRSTVAPAPTR